VPVPTTRIQPDPARHALYRELMPVYAACEAHALGRGPDPFENTITGPRATAR
jgi:hypothetical protein